MKYEIEKFFEYHSADEGRALKTRISIMAMTALRNGYYGTAAVLGERYGQANFEIDRLETDPDKYYNDKDAYDIEMRKFVSNGVKELAALLGTKPEDLYKLDAARADEFFDIEKDEANRKYQTTNSPLKKLNIDAYEKSGKGIDYLIDLGKPGRDFTTRTDIDAKEHCYFSFEEFNFATTCGLSEHNSREVWEFCGACAAAFPLASGYLIDKSVLAYTPRPEYKPIVRPDSLEHFKKGWLDGGGDYLKLNECVKRLWDECLLGGYQTASYNWNNQQK